MLKWLVRWFNKIFKFPFGQQQTRSTKLTGEEMVMEPPPELSNADLEFLFTQLLEGVHQARGQQWALRYLQRMENRISLERWIDWLLDFGERLLISSSPNNQIAERLILLGELGIGTIGELAYDIGIRLLTRNLGNSYPDTDRHTETTTTRLTPIDEEFIHNPKQRNNNTEKVTPASSQNSPEQGVTNHVNQRVRQDTKPDAKMITPAHQTASDEGEQEWMHSSKSLSASSREETDDSASPPVAVTLDELLVRLEQSTNLVQQLATGLGIESSESLITTNSPTDSLLSSTEQAQVWFYQGLAAAKEGNLSEAIVSYDKAIEINPNSYEYWFNRGLTLFYLEYFTEAIASYDQAISLKVDFYKCWYYRGGALGELGYYEDAIACFDKAIEIKFDYPDAWASRGVALVKLGHYIEAVASYDKALLLQPEDQENWYYRGIALAQGGRSNDAIASYDKALEIQLDFYEAWYNRGVELSDLERFKDASASLKQAVEIQPDFHEAWYALGTALDKLGRHNDAIASYDQALEIQPELHEVWIDRGVVLASLGRWDEAISSWEEALEIQPDFYLAWFNRAVALENLGRREDAVVSYDRALEINPSFYLAWYNRAVVLFYTGRFEEAIVSYDYALQNNLDYWEAWIGRGAAAGNAVHSDSHLIFSNDIAYSNPSLYSLGYEGKLASYLEGLKYVSQDAQSEGWGRLHLAIANAHYDEGRRYAAPRNYWQQAVTHYNEALKTLTVKEFTQLHLEVLQNLIKTHVALGQTTEAQELQQYATELLQELLSEPTSSSFDKKQIALKNAGFWQLAVDIALQFGEIAQALEIAEHSKNACITWLLSGWKDEIVSPSYESFHELLNPTTAIIYWYISPCALRTFVIKHKSPEPIPIFTPVLNIEVFDEMPLPEAVKRLVEFEDWLEDWNQHELEYRNPSPDAQDNSHHSWLSHMEQRLLRLKEILNISAIVNELEDITHLILVPHRDLHRFPLHALFHLSPSQANLQQTRDDFTFTYLPSLQIGLSLKSQPLLDIQNLPILTVEYPDNINPSAHTFAKMESLAISQMFHGRKCIEGLQATKIQVENFLCGDYNILHFTGDVTDNFIEPQESELVLVGEDRLTLEDLCKKQIAKYNLITLSACEIAITSHSMITTEYVGLVSGLLSQGVGYIVGTLWTVESSASALVMIEFYRGLMRDRPAAMALAEATQWLRELNAGELKKWYEEIFNSLSQEGTRIKANLATELYRSSKLPADTKLYNHPYYWAGFTIAGKFHSYS